MNNAKFIEALYQGRAEGSYGWETSFTAPPDSSDPNERPFWGGRPVYEYSTLVDRQYSNTFCCVSTFVSGPDVKPGRRKTLFSGMHALMIDDIGTKVRLDDIPVKFSALIETSPNNYQGWLFFRSPIFDRAQAELLVERWIAKGFAKDAKDPGMSGVTRYARLPIGINNKLAYESPFKHVLHEWNPDTRYSLDELAEIFGLDLTPAPPRIDVPPPEVNAVDSEDVLEKLKGIGLYKGMRGDGWHDITCPWVSEHTGEIDNGAGYATPSKENEFKGGFRCHHGHCSGRNLRNLLQFIEDSINPFEQFKEVVDPETGEITTVAQKPELFECGSAILNESTKTEWLIKTILPQSGIGMLYGDSQTFKSFTTLDWALSIANGIAWNEYEVKQGAVAYIAGEGRKGLKKRIKGWLKTYGGDLDFFYLKKGSINLMDPKQIKAVREYFMDANKQPKFLVIDTYRRNISSVGGKPVSENSSDDFGVATNLLQTIADEFDATILLVHHTNKSGGYSGTSAFETNIDCMYRQSRGVGDLSVILYNEKLKDEDQFEPITLQGEKVIIDFEDGEDTLVFKKVGGIEVSHFNLEKHILRAIRKAGELSVSSYIKNSTEKLSRTSVDRAFASLEGSKQIRNLGKRGREIFYSVFDQVDITKTSPEAIASTSHQEITRYSQNQGNGCLS